MDGKELKRYDELKLQLQFFRAQSYEFEGRLQTLGPQLHRAREKLGQLEHQVETLSGENAVLRQRLTELTQKLDLRPQTPPAFVKANVPGKRAKHPGRPAGHAAAQRPVPVTIDTHIDVPVPRDATGVASCPHCHVQLSDVKHHERIVEDIIPAKAVVTCYHTTSGYCPGCRKRIESRAPE